MIVDRVDPFVTVSEKRGNFEQDRKIVSSCSTQSIQLNQYLIQFQSHSVPKIFVIETTAVAANAFPIICDVKTEVTYTKMGMI